MASEGAVRNNWADPKAGLSPCSKSPEHPLNSRAHWLSVETWQSLPVDARPQFRTNEARVAWQGLCKRNVPIRQASWLDRPKRNSHGPIAVKRVCFRSRASSSCSPRSQQWPQSQSRHVQSGRGLKATRVERAWGPIQTLQSCPPELNSWTFPPFGKSCKACP